MSFAQMAAQGQIINLGRGRRANKLLPLYKGCFCFAVLRVCDERRRAKFCCGPYLWPPGRMSRCFAPCAALSIISPRSSSNFLAAWWMGIIFCRLLRLRKAKKFKQPEWVARQLWERAGTFFCHQSFLLNIINQHRVLLANILRWRKYSWMITTHNS